MTIPVIYSLLDENTLAIRFGVTSHRWFDNLAMQSSQE